MAGWTWRTPLPPWLPGWPPQVFLDVYVVDGFAALGALNAAVPGDALWGAHEAVAVLAAHGSGGLYQCRAGAATPGRRTDAHDGTVRLDWLDRPVTSGVVELVGSLSGAGETVWIRQLALGPGPEVLVVGAGAETAEGRPGDPGRRGEPGGPVARATRAITMTAPLVAVEVAGQDPQET